MTLIHHSNFRKRELLRPEFEAILLKLKCQFKVCNTSSNQTQVQKSVQIIFDEVNKSTEKFINGVLI